MRTAMTAAWNRELQEEAAVREPFKQDIKQRFLAWFDSQPDVSRIRPYSMVELERALNTPGKTLSAVLLSLGWERRRKWSSKGHSPRYWVPPAIG